MNKRILLYILTFGFLTISYAQQYGWVVLNADSISGTPDFSDVFFINDSMGWISSSSQANIYKTENGALSFSTQTAPLGATNAIHMLDTINGYSGGDGGWVYKTSNGGQNWNILASMGTLLDISFPPGTLPSSPVGYACGNNGQVWEITSTLTNLNSPSNSTLAGVSAPSVNNVWVCGGNRIYYYNGTSFTSQIAPTGTFNDIHFINNQEGWVVGDNGIIGHTTDGGFTWNDQTNPDTQNRSLYGVFFLDSNIGWIVGFNGIILHTIDGGSNWNIEAAGLTIAFLRGVHFTSPTNGYVVGNNKTLLKYTEVSGTGNELLETLQFNVFPNPANNKIEIRSSEFFTKNCTIELHDVYGKILIIKQIATGYKKVEIDVCNLAGGVYFCTLKTDKKSSTKKLIIE
jgi:photosystem II stability/assembly factor-like uncharacterized protein